MSKFVLSSRSTSNLKGVHPDLVKVVKRALTLTKVDFGVSEGLRTIEKQREYVAQGKSKTMNSMHLLQKDGYSHAVDLYAFVNGKASWDHKKLRKIAGAMFKAAFDLGVPIEWGGHWETFSDMPHFELDRDYYPK